MERAGPKVYIQSYGCAMNNADSDIVRAVLAQNGYGVAEGDDDADVVLLNTCAIREKVTLARETKNCAISASD